MTPVNKKLLYPFAEYSPNNILCKNIRKITTFILSLRNNIDVYWPNLDTRRTVGNSRYMETMHKLIVTIENE